jgi:hypothetical protein
MNVFLVRVVQTNIAVGIFWCKVGDLIHLIGEEADPLDCEYVILPPGGVVWFGNEARLPHKHRDSAKSDERWNHLLNVNWLSRTSCDLSNETLLSNKKWKPLRRTKAGKEEQARRVI